MSSICLHSFSSKTELDAGERSLAHMEKNILNRCGYFPIVSSITAGLRLVIAEWEIISGLGLWIISRSRPYHIESAKFAKRSFQIMKNGAGNVVRSVVEAVPFTGNVACILYDAAHLRMKYPIEKFR